MFRRGLGPLEEYTTDDSKTDIERLYKTFFNMDTYKNNRPIRLNNIGTSMLIYFLQTV